MYRWGHCKKAFNVLISHFDIFQLNKLSSEQGKTIKVVVLKLSLLDVAAFLQMSKINRIALLCSERVFMLSSPT